MTKETHEILTIEQLHAMGILANSSISLTELKVAQKRLCNIHALTAKAIKNGKGPFYAEIYDDKGNLIAAAANSVVEDNCSICHAEMNTLKLAHEKLKSYNLAPFNLSIYINAEPCLMCAGGLMWSGIKNIFFSVPSADVENITGFDEGYKPDWINEFKKRGISVYGNIESETGKKVMFDYVNSGKTIYKPR